MSVVTQQSTRLGALKRCEVGDVGVRTFRLGGIEGAHIICLPFGGGSSHIFAGVAGQLPTSWTVRAVEYPGHLHGWGETIDQIDQLCEALIRGLGISILESSWIMGHSLGGLVSLRLTHLLEQHGRRPKGCIACAVKPPSRIDSSPHLSNLSRKNMLSRWLDMLGQDRSANTDALFDLIEPILRADMRVYESCAGIDIALTHTPLLVLSSEGDEIVPLQYEYEWGEVAAHVQTDRVAGGHLFVLSNPSHLAARIVRFVQDFRVAGGNITADYSSGHR